MAEKRLSKEIQLPEYLGSFDTSYIISQMFKFSQILFFFKKPKFCEENWRIFENLLEIFYFLAMINLFIN
jgi:hypothetical protein